MPAGPRERDEMRIERVILGRCASRIIRQKRAYGHRSIGSVPDAGMLRNGEEPASPLRSGYYAAVAAVGFTRFGSTLTPGPIVLVSVTLRT